MQLLTCPHCKTDVMVGIQVVVMPSAFGGPTPNTAIVTSGPATDVPIFTPEPAAPDPLAWRDDTPPHAGWWNASVGRETNVWRWWDGSNWSEPVNDRATAVWAAAITKQRPILIYAPIYWRSYYPADARVPRVNPATGERTC